MRAITLSAMAPFTVYIITSTPPNVPDKPQAIHQLCLVKDPAPGFKCDPATGKIVKIGAAPLPPAVNHCTNKYVAPGYTCDPYTGKVRPWGPSGPPRPGETPDRQRIPRQCEQIHLLPGYFCDLNTGAIVSTLPPEQDPMRDFCNKPLSGCRIVTSEPQGESVHETIRDLNEDLAIERREKAAEAQRQAEEQARAAEERARQAEEAARASQEETRRAAAEEARRDADAEQERARSAARTAADEDRKATALTVESDQRTRSRIRAFLGRPLPLDLSAGRERGAFVQLSSNDPILANYKAFYPADGQPSPGAPALVRTKAGEGRAPLSSTLMIPALAGRIHDLAVAVRTADPILTLRITAAYATDLPGPFGMAFRTARNEGRGVDLTLTRNGTILRGADQLRLLEALAREVGFRYASMQDAETDNGHVYASIDRPPQNAATYAQYDRQFRATPIAPAPASAVTPRVNPRRAP